MFRLPRASQPARLLACLCLAVCAFPALACGVPLPPGSLTATAVTDGASASRSTETSSILASDIVTSREQAVAGVARTPLATPAGTRAATPSSTTPTRTPTPGGSVTATPTAGGSTTPTATPSATETPAPSSLSPSSANGTPTPTSANDPTSLVLKLVNDFRQGRGRGPLTANPNLNIQAHNYAKLMADNNTFSHNGPDGSSPALRVAVSGYNGAFQGEALAAGQPDAAAAVLAWINSPSHLAVLLDPAAVEVGIGYYYQGQGGSYVTYWVMDTGVPR